MSRTLKSDKICKYVKLSDKNNYIREVKMLKRLKKTLKCYENN